MWKISVLLLASIVLNSPRPLKQDTSRVEGELELNGAFTTSRAMSLIYGSYDDAEETSVWNPERQKSYPHYWPDKVNVRVLLDVAYLESGISKHLLATWALPKESYEGEFTCHGCGVLIGLTLFAKTRGVWHIEAYNLQFGEYGSWGRPPDIYLQPLGPDHFGLMMPTSFGAQGAYEQTIAVIIPRNGNFIVGLAKQISQSWDEDGCSGKVSAERAENCIAYDGSIEWESRSGAELYDLLLTRRVYRSLSKRTPKGTTVTRFHFDGLKYVAKSTVK